MKAIIVPLDFSPVSLNAVNYAQKVARQTGAKLILLHAFLSPSMMPVIDAVELTEEGLWDFYDEELRHVASSLEKQDPFLKVETMQFRGTVSESVQQLSETIDTQMIVMGIRGAGAGNRLLFGSNTLRVAENAAIPVLIVPPNAQFSSITDIGLTTDLKQVDTRVPEKKIEEILLLFGARLHILNVDNRDKNWSNDTPLQSGYLESMFQEFHPTYHFIDHPDLSEGLSSCAEENSIELMIAVKGKYSWLQKFFHKNHIRELGIHSRIPLMVIPSA